VQQAGGSPGTALPSAPAIGATPPSDDQALRRRAPVAPKRSGLIVPRLIW
jgi:hypothetical protein